MFEPKDQIERELLSALEGLNVDISVAEEANSPTSRPKAIDEWIKANQDVCNENGYVFENRNSYMAILRKGKLIAKVFPREEGFKEVTKKPTKEYTYKAKNYKLDLSSGVDILCNEVDLGELLNKILIGKVRSCDKN